MSNLIQLVEAVNDEDSFLRFVSALHHDRMMARNEGETGSGPEEHRLESDTIEDFLEAAIAWAKDSEFGRRVQLAEVSPWKQFAAFLFCGKIYE